MTAEIPIVGLVDKATVDAADIARLRAENAKMKSQISSLRANGRPHTLLALEWGATIHGYRCNARTGTVMHSVVMLNEDSREVRCRFCGEVLDAFEVLLEFARCERQFNFNVDENEQRLARLRIDVEELGRARKNLMAASAKARKMIRDGEAVAAAAIQAAARADAEAVEAAAAQRAADEERIRSEPLLELYETPKDPPPRRE